MGPFGLSPSNIVAYIVLVLGFASILIAFETALAHRPMFAGEKSGDPTSAVRVTDPAVSHVIYVHLTADEPHKWFVLENDTPQRVPLIVGIPRGISPGVVEPMVVLFGPGWGDLPVGIPFRPPATSGDHDEESGGIAVSVTGERYRFYEPVTGTESQIVVDTELDLPERGRYYGVVYDAGGHEGKLWVSVGQSEGFSWRDVFRLPGWIGKVRSFHEVGGWPRWARIGLLVLLAATFVVVGWWRIKRTTV